MERNHTRMMVGLCAIAVAIATGGCGRDAHDVRAVLPAKSAHEHDAKHEQDANDGRDGEREAPGISSADPFEERASANCEHDVPTYRCAECRYELGVVKLDPGLLKREDGGGLVTTQTVTRSLMSPTLRATGEVTLNENAAVRISPRITGIIESVRTDIGASVKAGDILLTLAGVELGNALAQHERNRALAELAEKTFNREKSLWEQKVCSEQDMIDARMVYEQHRAELRASEEALRVLGLSESDVERMRNDPRGAPSGSLPVRAPIAGTIIEKRAVPGETVEAGAELMVLADLRTVWVWASVHAQDLPRLLDAEKRGRVAVEIAVTAFPDRRFEGELTYVGATMSQETRMVKVRATVENPDMALRPGMFCEAAIAIGEGQAEEVLAVPRHAILSDEGKNFVFRHWKDDFFVRQYVRKGRELHGAVELLDGLQAGETIVVEGAFLLKSDILREKMGAGCAD